jgi:hypothetical protein
MPLRFELGCMGLDDPRDLRQLPPIVSALLSSLELASQFRA